MRAVAQTIQIKPARQRNGRRRAAPPPQSKRKLREQAGRAWINGAEVGGSDARFAHLDRSYD